MIEVSLKELKRGDSGGEVLAMQSLLNGIDNAFVMLSGEFDAQTEKALARYQKSVDIPQTKVCDGKTWYHLLNGIYRM